MPKKKSIKLAAKSLETHLSDTIGFVDEACRGLSKAHTSRVYDAAIIALYRDFEEFIVEVLVGAINNDTQTVSSILGVSFPTHLTDEVCRYIITGPSYFDFKGRDGLVKRVKQYVPKDHFLVTSLKDRRYKETIEQLCVLRNFAAHGSPQARRAALAAISQTRVRTAGSWLKVRDRLRKITNKLLKLAQEVGENAPY